jgi:hypothetical protein
MAIRINGIKIDRDRCAFLQDVELEDGLPVKKFFVRVIAGSGRFFRR